MLCIKLSFGFGRHKQFPWFGSFCCSNKFLGQQSVKCNVRNILNSESKRTRSGGVLDGFSGIPILPQGQKAKSKTVINFSEEFFHCLELPSGSIQLANVSRAWMGDTGQGTWLRWYEITILRRIWSNCSPLYLGWRGGCLRGPDLFLPRLFVSGDHGCMRLGDGWWRAGWKEGG